MIDKFEGKMNDDDDEDGQIEFFHNVTNLEML